MRMKKILFTILCLLVLSPAVSRAETITHNFHEMSGLSQLTFSSANKVGETDLVTYTCSGTGATFGVTNSKICIQLPQNGSQVVTSPAIEGLTNFRIYHYPSSVCSNINVYISTNGSTWGAALSGAAIEYGYGVIYVTVPKGNYYVKIANSTATSVSVFQVIYTTEESSCSNCFEYIPE